MNYLEYDNIVKKRCPECHAMDSLQGKNKKLFGRSFPENGGNLYNRIKHMKGKYMNKEKPNYDPRDIALLYTLNEGFKKGDYNTDEDGYSNYGEKPNAPTHITDFDIASDISILWESVQNDPLNRDVVAGFMSSFGHKPVGGDKGGRSSSDAFKVWKSRQKTHFIHNVFNDDPQVQYNIHDAIDSSFATMNSGFPQEELDEDHPGLESYAYGTGEDPAWAVSDY